MTKQKKLKRRIRARMEQTGQSYSDARRTEIGLSENETPKRTPASHAEVAHHLLVEYYELASRDSVENIEREVENNPDGSLATALKEVEAELRRRGWVCGVWRRQSGMLLPPSGVVWTQVEDGYAELPAGKPWGKTGWCNGQECLTREEAVWVEISTYAVEIPT